MAAGAVWTAGAAKWTANMDGTGHSVAAGLMGTDGTGAFDAGSIGVIWLHGDPLIATAAGQTRSQCAVPRNAITLQTGSKDLSTCTLTTYTGPSSSSFFPERSPGGCPCWHWPTNGGAVLETKMIINTLRMESAAGSFGFRTRGATVFLVEDPTDTPTSWNMKPIDLPGGQDCIVFSGQIFDPGDGWLYFTGETDVNERAVYMARAQRADAKLGKIDNFQYWMGTVRGFGSGKPRRFANDWPLAQVAPPNTFRVSQSIHQRSGDWIQVASQGFPQADLRYGLATSMEGPFPDPLTSFFTPPESTAVDGSGHHKYMTYSGSGHPEQTWSGKGSNDMLVMYSSQGISPVTIFNDNTCYWPVPVKGTNLT